MTREEIARMPRQTAQELITAVPGGPGYDKRIVLAVEQALNAEWWRGFYRGVQEIPTP